MTQVNRAWRANCDFNYTARSVKEKNMARLFSPLLYTLEDLLEQSVVMMACIGWGWLSVVVMLLSLGEGLIKYFGG